MDNWVELLRNNKKQNTPKQGFIMGVSGGGKKYSSREYDSTLKDENIEHIFINVEEEYEKLGTKIF